jgi:small-conductance mechanosensitive channel
VRSSATEAVNALVDVVAGGIKAPPPRRSTRPTALAAPELAAFVRAASRIHVHPALDAGRSLVQPADHEPGRGRSMTGSHRRASPVYAAIGVVAFVFMMLVLLAQLATIHPALAVAALVLGPVVVGWAALRRIRDARPGERILPSPAKAYVELSQAGREATREATRSIVDVALIVAVVLGWAVIAVLAVIALFLPTALLGIDNPIASVAVWLVVPAFFGCLVVGPLWTLRRLRR